MTPSEQQVYDFISAITKEFGKCELMAKGELGVVVKTSGFVHKRYKEFTPATKVREKMKK